MYYNLQSVQWTLSIFYPVLNYLSNVALIRVIMNESVE